MDALWGLIGQAAVRKQHLEATMQRQQSQITDFGFADAKEPTQHGTLLGKLDNLFMVFKARSSCCKSGARVEEQILS